MDRHRADPAAVGPPWIAGQPTRPPWQRSSGRERRVGGRLPIARGDRDRSRGAPRPLPGNVPASGRSGGGIAWSIDPAIYAVTSIDGVVAAHAPDPCWQHDRICARHQSSQIAAVLGGSVRRQGGPRRLPGCTCIVATPKHKAATVLPSSNGDTGVRLHPFLQDVDIVRRREDGFRPHRAPTAWRESARPVSCHDGGGPHQAGS